MNSIINQYFPALLMGSYNLSAGFYNKKYLFFKVVWVVNIAILSVFSLSVQSQESCLLEGAKEENGCWYVGAGFGAARMAPVIDPTLWKRDENKDVAFKVLIGKGFTDHWFGELRYENMGKTEISDIGPTISEQHTLDYSALGFSTGYWLFEQEKEWNLYGKVGVGYIKTSPRNPVSQKRSSQLTLSVGAQWRFSEHWFARADIDTYEREAQVIGFTIGRYFGAKKKSISRKITAPVKLAVAQVEPKVVTPDSAANPGLMSDDDDNDGILDHVDLCPSTPKGDVVGNDGCKLLEKITLYVQFENGSDVVSKQYFQEISRVADKIKQFKNVRVAVEGHTDWTGKQAINQPLSERRAAAVTRLLIKQTGLPVESFTVKGFGELRPIADNTNAKGRFSNRRVEISISN